MADKQLTPIEQWQSLSRNVPRAYSYPQAGGDEGLKLLAGMGDLLAGILQELRETVPQGIVYAVDNYVIPAGTLTPEVIVFDQPLFNIAIINSGGGGGTVQYRLPYSSTAQWTNLNVNEQDTFNAIKPVFTSIAFINLTATAANLRLRGVY